MSNIKKIKEPPRVIEHAIHITETSLTFWLSSIAFVLLSFFLFVL